MQPIETPAGAAEAAAGNAPSPAGRPGRARRWLRRTVLGVVGGAGLIAAAALGGGLWLRDQMQDNLPQIDGRLAVVGLAAPVRVDRDAFGVPTLTGTSRSDVAFATGFVHAQDRLFQMDVLRRRSAGRLSELMGELTLDADIQARRHRLGAVARQALAASPPDVRVLLAAYARGVNAGIASLGEIPFEYLLLRSEPAPWKPEDSLLVLLTMYLQQADAEGSFESTLGLMRDRLPEPLFAFLTPQGTEWDAPLVGAPVPPVPLPGSEVMDLRRKPVAAARAAAAEIGAVRRAASNLWALDGRRTADGRPLLANDLHLDIEVPNLWYRVALVWPAPEGCTRRVTGMTLPGSPAVVIGSNGRVAWGVSNSGVDVTDVVLLDVDPARPDTYRTPGGPRRFARHREVLRLRGGEERTAEVLWTVWGPVLGKDQAGRQRAVRWMGQQPEAVNFEILGLEGAGGVAEALAVAQRSGVPPLNFVAADAAGHIGWTIMGRLPRRAGFDGRLPGSWADGTRRWEGLLPPAETPRLLDPAEGRIWNGNNRMVDGEALARLGDGGYRLSARARQIRDTLRTLQRATPEDMRRLQLDDRALFLQRWRDLLLEVLTPEAVAADPRRRELRDQVQKDWPGHAAVDSAGYRMVRTFRTFLAGRVFSALTAPCKEAVPDFDYLLSFDQWEAPLWRLVTERPPHLLDPRFATWNDQLLAAVDEVLDYFEPQGPLRERTWGERNTAAIRHRFSAVFPGAGRWLDMPAEPLPGDDHMPRVQDPVYGATIRMVVSPGREREGFYNMPGGESGNPLSPHYRDAHAAWVKGDAVPFLPGPPVHRLELRPGS